jgi:hypothetical protein
VAGCARSDNTPSDEQTRAGIHPHSNPHTYAVYPFRYSRRTALSRIGARERVLDSFLSLVRYPSEGLVSVGLPVFRRGKEKYGETRSEILVRDG